MTPDEPRLRQATRVRPLYPLNDYPADFAEKLAKKIFVHRAKNGGDLEGKQWEEIFAACIGANWSPSPIGLDDIRHQQSSTAWGAKTVKGRVATSEEALIRPQRVRLISGRNAPVYSYDRAVDPRKMAPAEVGSMVLGIWNQRVREVRSRFSNLRTVVLIKEDDLSRVAVFEHETTLFIPEDYTWKWNVRGNLEGARDGMHKFTWQPHGAQFTIVEEVPEEALRLEVSEPPQLVEAEFLKQLKFSSKSFRLI